MKSCSFLLGVVFSLFLAKANGQEYIEPQWKFYFAFEDATGARDTLWVCLDSAVTTWGPGENTQFGEVPFDVPEDAFAVYSDYSFSEWTQVKVANIEWPTTWMIYASNYTLPLTLSWDPALFNAPVLQQTVAGPICNPRLDSDWFVYQENAPWLHHQWSMIFDSQTELPEFWWGSQNHFPITVYFDRSHNCMFLSTEESSLSEQLELFPNPCTDELRLRSGAALHHLEVYNLQGQLLMQQGPGLAAGAGAELRLDVQPLPPGMYLLHVQDATGRKGLKKFVKGE